MPVTFFVIVKNGIDNVMSYIVKLLNEVLPKTEIHNDEKSDLRRFNCCIINKITKGENH
ncbi:MAG: hypothetical protein LBS55_05845 [Prevotellaceae bacterium]|jgi:hypothetical protein|nr:hypothetical protein [Prevotellaceae bacterium]